MKNIDGMSISGSGEVVGETPVKSDRLALDVSGSGKVTLQLAVKSLDINISGVGKMVLSGTADEAKINISGSGKVEGYDLKIASCTADVSGVGKCNMDVTDSLTTNISGMGSINYKTKPKYLKEDVSGVGKINDEKFIGSNNDTTRFKLGSSDVLIISSGAEMKKHWHRNKSTHPIWQGFEMGFNNYLNSSGKAEVPSAYSYLDLNTGKSVYVALNLLQKDFELGKSNTWFFTGLGITWNNYRFDKNVVLTSGPDVSGGFDTTSTRSYQKSKLLAIYLTAPLMFEVFTSHNIKNAFHIGAGGMLGYRIGSHSKTKYDEAGSTSKPKTYGDFNLNSFRYGMRVALGYGKFNVFGDYYASSLFKNGIEPALYPFDFGITLIGF
jgi:hypothetical protein